MTKSFYTSDDVEIVFRVAMLSMHNNFIKTASALKIKCVFSFEAEVKRIKGGASGLISLGQCPRRQMNSQ